MIINQFTASLWGDEAFSAILSMKSVSQIISIIIRDTSPPLFNLTEHFWFKAFGSSEIAIRLLVSLYFLIAVFFVYKIGEYLWNKTTGLLAAVLTLLNPFFFTYAFEGRMYSLLAATVTASMYFFIKKNWPAYVVATTLALYSHHFALFAVFTQGVWFLVEFFRGNRSDAFSMFKSFLAIALLYTPWLLPLYNQTKMVGGGFWLGKPDFKDAALLVGKYLNVTFVLLFFRNWKKDSKTSVILLSWFLTPILLTFIISQKFQSIFFDRYMLYVIPAAMLLAASNLKKIAKLPLFLLVATLIYTDIFYFAHPTKRPFRDLANYVKDNRRGDDYLINWNGTAHHLWEAKYYGIPAPIYIPGGQTLPYFVGTALMDASDIITSIPPKTGTKKTNRVGVITSASPEEIKVVGYGQNEIKSFGDLKFIWMLKAQ